LYNVLRVTYTFLNLQIILEGVRGSGTKGDIAVDDIKLYTGACKPDSGGCIKMCYYYAALL